MMEGERRRRSDGAPQRRSPRRAWYIAGGVVFVIAAFILAPYSYLFRTPINRHSVDINPLIPGRRAVPPRIANPLTSHVIIISIDGLRPDAIAEYEPATLSRLAREGALSLAARTVIPSLTLPSHTSMLTGTEPAVHGITWNTDLTIVRGQHLPVPTVFELAKQAGLTTAAFFSKSKFHHLEDLRALDYSQSPGGGWGKILAYRTASDVVHYLRYGRPHLTFVHLGDPDYTGHVMGWMSPAYGAAVRNADRAVGDILGAADRAFGTGRYVVIITSDHGGVGRTHGAPDARNRTIPWLAWGERVIPAARIAPGIRTMDTAATVLWLLGIGIPVHMVGRPVTGAFRRN